LNLSGIPAEQVLSVWDEVEPLVERVLPHADGEYTAETVLTSLLKRDMQLWIGHEDNKIIYMGISEMSQFPSGQIVATIVMVAGERVDEWLEDLTLFEDWAKANGASKVRLMGRPGWRKKLNYKNTYTVLSREL